MAASLGRQDEDNIWGCDATITPGGYKLNSQVSKLEILEAGWCASGKAF